MTEGSRSELDWVAFQYVAGELSPEDVDRFEKRLVNDQAAREAVASAVELTQVSAVAFEHWQPVVPVATQPRWLSRLPWVGCGVAAGLALALVFVQVLPAVSARRGGPELAAGPELAGRELSVSAGLATRPLDAEVLALTWVATRGNLTPEMPGLAPDDLSLDLRNTELTLTAWDGEADAGIQPPSWMLTAVADGLADRSVLSGPTGTVVE